VTCDRRWFSPGTLVSATNKTGRHDITKILLKVALSTINPTPPNPIFENYNFFNLQITLKTLGAQMCGLFVEVETTKFTTRLSTLFPLLQKELEVHSTEQEVN
jgi:hypothetical protein